MNIVVKLKELIKQNGSIPVDKFMEMVVPYYYKNNSPFGKNGDFVTAPEVSQMFGEMIGIWCANHWLNKGKNKFTLVEIGGGNGTLMDDLLRGTKNIKGFHDSIEQIAMVEISPALKEKQKAKILFSKINWYSDLKELDSENCIIICNEFFDALPIKQFIKEQDGFKEVHIGLKDDEFEFVTKSISLSNPTSHPELVSGSIEMLKQVQHDKNMGFSIIEKSESSIRYAEVIKQKISSIGAALIIDYGYIEPSYKSTLQALKNHKFHNVLKEIGEADITAHVDFKSLAKVFDSFKADIIPQGDFLIRCGIMARAAMLIDKGADPKEIHEALARLINNDQMGQLFKVLEITN